MIWNCVEDRINDGTKYGRVIRKIIFGDIFKNKTDINIQNSISYQNLHLLKVFFIYISQRGLYIYLTGRRLCIIL